MNILRNDEVTLIKEIDNLKKVGDTYEVANITDTKIVIRDRNTKMAIAAIKIENFEKYFKKDYVVNGWTDWITIGDGINNLVGYYRTNQKRVEVKTVDGKFIGKSSCNKTDKFSLDRGIKLAMARCYKKILEDYTKKLDIEAEKARDCLLEYNRSLAAVNKYIKNFSKE